MPTTVLQHCVQVTIYRSDLPGEVDLQLTVGGAAGDGYVDVLASPDGVTPSGPVYANGAAGFHASECLSIKLHYHRSEGKPTSVPVTYSYTVL